MTANEVWMSIPTESSDCSGKNSRVCSVVKATTVPIVMTAPPWAIE